jgi:histidinol-phosphate aminotransferase
LGISAIKLASNENPLGPSPRAVEAAKKALGESNRYPDANGTELRQALSRKHDLPMEQIILGAGSSELIDLAARLTLRPENTGVTSFGSFPLYYIAIRAARAKLIETPLKDYRFDLDAIARSLGPETGIVFLANPNNPTGTMFTADEFDVFLSRVPPHVLVVLDEAYCDYIARPDYSRSVELVRRGANLVVLRTFSKVYGLAGLRIGYGLGPAGIFEEMNKIRGPFTASIVGQAAALAALEDRDHVRRSIDCNRAGLAQLERGLEELGVRCVPSVGNFILGEFGYDTEPLCEELTRLGVMVRPMRWMGFPQAVRVSVGTHAENERFLSALACLKTFSAAGASKRQGKPGRKTETHRKGQE